MNKALLFVAMTVVCILNNCAFAQLDQNTVRFVGEVLTNSEYKSDRGAVTVRWAAAPTLSTFGPSSQHPAYVKKVVTEINSGLPDKFKIQLRASGDETATIKVIFAPAAKLKEIGNEHGFEYVDRNWGFFFTRWNHKLEIQKAVVLIAEDKISGKRLQHFLLEEITQSLGFAGDSSRFRNSVFYETTNQFGDAISLSATDKKLIRFHYEHVPPGSHAIEVGILMAKHW